MIYSAEYKDELSMNCALITMMYIFIVFTSHIKINMKFAIINMQHFHLNSHKSALLNSLI